MALVKKTVVDKVEGYMKDIVGFEGLYAITRMERFGVIQKKHVII